MLLGTAATAGLAEALVRALHPAPRVQVIRLDLPGLRHVDQDGVTLVWDPFEGDLVRAGPCRPGQPVIGVVGDSIEMVTDLDGPNLAGALGDALRARGVDACLLDGAWAGWVPRQELAMLDRLLAAPRLDAVVLGVWKADERYTRVGDLLVAGDLLAHDDRGVPRPPLPVPGAVHDALLQRSELWRFATLALAPEVPPPRPPDAAYRDAVLRAEAAGVPVVLLEAAFLDKPLADTIAARRHDGWQATLAAWAAGHGARHLWIADALQGEDVAAVRHDTCCHLNGEGHRGVAERLAPLVQAALDDRRRLTASSSSAAQPPSEGDDVAQPVQP